MTEYEELMNKSDECCLRAIKSFKEHDWNTATFWKNVSVGLKELALTLTLKQGSEVIK